MFPLSWTGILLASIPGIVTGWVIAQFIIRYRDRRDGTTRLREIDRNKRKEQ